MVIFLIDPKQKQRYFTNKNNFYFNQQQSLQSQLQILIQLIQKLYKKIHMKINEINQQRPFSVQQKETKVKKKSIVSQRMKEKKQKNKELYNNNNAIYNNDQDSDSEPVIIRRPKRLQSPTFYDNINYVTLQQFEGTIEDQRTLQAYSNAIKQSSHLFVNKIVLHLTTGFNFYYSIYAAEVGAAKVYCVVNGHNLPEKQNVWMMRQIIKENQLEEIVEVLSFKDFNAEVDIIIGEPMGFCMHYDGMLDRMIQARDLFLDKRNGLIFPSKLSFKCAFINDDHFYDKKVQFWNQVYGIPMKSMQKWISHEPMIRIVDPSLIVSEIKKFIEFDLMIIKYEEIEQISREFRLKILEDTQANGLTIWFEIQFNCEGQKTQLKGSPWQNPTKFTHVTLYTSKKLILDADTNVRIKMYGKKYPHHGVSVMKVNIRDEIESVYTFS